MLIEIHMIQNHAPSNLNRDDTGSPKDCMFGGVRRSRISSQALKRAIRCSSVFRDELDEFGLGVRTRQLPAEVKRVLLERGLSEEMAEIGALKASGFGNRDGKERAELETAQMMYLTPQDIEVVAEVIYQAGVESATPAAFKNVKAKDLEAKARDTGWRPITPDVALFGRMITSDAFRDVQASLQVAHAISTHRMEHEFDYFTAVDDLLDPIGGEDDRGAGMIGDIEFNSACYYKYFSIDLQGFIENLAGSETPANLAEAGDMARRMVLAFLKAAVFTTPSGKQNTFAAHQLPDAILVEMRAQKIPISYANAFVQPVQPRLGEDLVELSIKRFKDHVEMLTRKYSLLSIDRIWFTTRDVALDRTTTSETLDDLLQQLSNSIGSWLPNE
jgi:CRISPR system Cascade subunit CasC